MTAGWGDVRCAAPDRTGDQCVLPSGHVGNHLTALQRDGQTVGKPPATPPSGQQPVPAQLGGVIGLVVLALFALYAVGVIRLPTSPSAVGLPVVNTWTRSANYTTCTQWLNEMTTDQRRTMASDILPILRQTVDTAASDGLELVPRYVDDISSTCRDPAIGDPGQYVVTAAAALAFGDDKALEP